MLFEDLNNLYKQNFSLGYLGKSIENKLALISLICYVTYKYRLKKPDVTYYQVIMKICDGLGFSEDLIKALAIICEDFGYMCTEFPTFGLKGNEVINKIRELLNNYLPF